jgi:20S proteasome subunit beta 1
MDVVDFQQLKRGEVNLGVRFLILYSIPQRLRYLVKTSIMAVQFDGGVVLGADSRTTMGSYIVCILSLAMHSQPPYSLT